MVFFQDITEQKKLEEDREQYIKELEVFYEAATAREKRILDLKEEIRELKNKLGE